MLTVKLRDIIDSANTLSEIVNSARGKKLTPRIGRYLGTLVVDALNKEIPTYQKAVNEIIESYGNKNADDVPEVPKDSMGDFNTRRGVILDESRDLLHLYKITEDDLASCELAPVEWRQLNWLLVDAKEPA